MGKIKVLKKSTLSGRTENDDYKIYPVTKTEAVFTDSEDKDECDTNTPQGANKTTKEILNSIRKKDWVNNKRIKNGSVTKDKLGDDVLKQLNDNTATINDTIQHLNNTDQRLNNVSTILDNNVKQTNNNSNILSDVVKHVYPRILMNEDDLNELIANGGPFEEGMDYLAYEDNG